jgi:nitrile hydratase subunit alpha
MSDDHGHAHGGESDAALRTRAIESLLIEKGLLASDVVDRVVLRYEQDIGPMNGAKLVARAWVDPAFKERLLADGTAAAEEMGFGGNHLRVVENSATVHNLVVCTLCSCYPWAVLGLPPTWYKSFDYRARAVSEPRAVLGELGLALGSDVEVRVWDSSSEVRYMVLPERPAGTEGLSEEELAGLVTRDAMIGAAKVQAPAAAGSRGGR